MAQPPLDISGTAAPVGMDFWGDTSTANGGKGDPVDGLVCFPSVPQTIHIHSHLAVVLNGQLLQDPNNIGRVFPTATQAGCLYQLHNHDAGGRMHIEGPTPFTATLGNWFDVWGQPLSRDNVGGITGMPIVFYVTDNGVVTRWDDDPGTIELRSHRLITIQMASPPRGSTAKPEMLTRAGSFTTATSSSCPGDITRPAPPRRVPAGCRARDQ